MVKLLAWLHALLLRGCLWALKLPLKALWALLLSILALLGEEFRRWAGIAMAGLLIVVAGKVTLGVAPEAVKRPIVLAVLAMLALWALSVRRAAQLTRQNNLMRVRQRQAFRELHRDVRGMGGQVGRLRGELVAGAARRAKGTRAEVLFPSNREDRARRAAAEQAARERAAQTRAAERKAWEDEVVSRVPEDGEELVLPAHLFAEGHFQVPPASARTDSHYPMIRDRVQHNGITSPITVVVGDDGRAYVGDGNHQLAAVQELGLPDVPVRILRARGVGGMPLFTQSAEQQQAADAERIAAEQAARLPTNVLVATRRARQRRRTP
jgi:hypothetical protein